MAWLHNGRRRHCAAHERTLIPARSGPQTAIRPCSTAAAFAATWEGAALNKDYSTASVPLKENRREGGFSYRAKFINANRVIKLQVKSSRR